MSSLTTCIKKAGKALSQEDANSIREIAAELGDPKAAIDEHLESMADERAEIVEQVGGEQEAITSANYSLDESRGISATTIGDQSEFEIKQQRMLVEGIAESLAERKAAGEAIKTVERQLGVEQRRLAKMEEETTPEETTLRHSLEDEFLAELVDKEPNHPLSQTAKHGAIVVAAEQAAEQTSVVNLWSKIKDISREMTLNATPQTKLHEFIRSAMTSVRDYVRTMKRMDGFIDITLEEQAQTGGAWKKLFRSDPKGATLMGQLMHESSRLATDPSKPFEQPKHFGKMNAEKKKEWIMRKRNHAILQKEWNKLSPELQALYEKVRDDYVEQRTQLLAALERRIDDTQADGASKKALIAELRAQFEAGKVDPYFPLQRFGKHWATARDPETNRVVAFEKYESAAERNAWAAEMRKAGFRVSRSTDKNSNAENMAQIDPNFVAKVTDMVGKDKALQDEIWQMYLRTLPERSVRLSGIHRVGRLGYGTDALRAYGFNMFHGTHQLAKLKYGHELETHLEQVKTEASMLEGLVDSINISMDEVGLDKTHEAMLAAHPRYAQIFKRTKDKQKSIEQFKANAEKDAPWAVPLLNEMELRHQYNMNPSSATWATNLTSLGFFWFLSTSPAAGFLNLTQTAILGLPTLGARFSYKGAAVELSRASGQLVSRRGDLKNTLRGDERKAFEELEHIFAKTRTHDMTGYAERGENFASNTQGVVDVAQWIFHNTEKWNREVTALAAYRLARKAGRSHSAAVLEAEELVEKSHFDYTNTNRPRFMQTNGARVMLLFRNYSLNMTYRLARDFKDMMGGPNVDPATRKEAIKSFSGIIGMTGLIAGASGMPMAWAIHGILDAMMGDEDEPYNSEAAMRAYLTQQWGEDIATFITKGAWDSITGAQISNRASLNNLWLRDMPENMTNQEIVKYLFAEVTGPMGGIAVNVGSAADNFAQGHNWRAGEKMVPKFMSDYMKAIRYASEGALNYDRDIIMSPEEFKSRELFMQFIGFTPVSLNTRYEQGGAAKDHATALMDRSKNLKNKLFLAFKQNDSQTVKETLNEIKVFSKKNPHIAIDVKGLQQSAKIRARYDALAVDGTNVPEKLYYLHDQYRMTDEDDK